MRGKTRVSAALAFYGLALTAWLGIAALPSIQFPYWGALPIVLSLAGTALLAWGLTVYGIDVRRAKLSRTKDSGVLRAEIEASIARSKADISTNEYWRRIAANYRDEHRVRQIDATLAALRGELAQGERDLKAL